MKKAPNVLLLGYNYASVMHSLAEGFGAIGVPCRAISFELDRSIFNHYGNVEIVYKSPSKNTLLVNWQRLKGFLRLLRYLTWCDVVHVIFDTGVTGKHLELKLLKQLKRIKIINYLGSEVRDPAITLAKNPYFHHAFHNPAYEYRDESKANSDRMQRLFAEAGFLPVVFDTDIYINPEIFPRYFVVPHAAYKMDLPPSEKQGGKVLVVHSPSAPVAKGTEFVLKAIEKLKQRGNRQFEFKLLKGIPNHEYQEYIAKADVLVDQFMWGAYGIATAQAMSFGKVVVCYLLPERIERYYGKDCPIVNANVDDLADVLEKLIADPQLRSRLGEQSKAYYNRMHSPKAVAKKMLDVYNSLSAGEQ